jgi:hypothetical protein
MIVGSNILAGASGQGGNYLLNRSVRLRSSASAYFNRTPSVAGNQRTWTWSGWVKIGNGTSTQIFGAATSTSYVDMLTFGAAGVSYYSYFSGAYQVYVQSTAVFRDPSAWYHVVLSVDTTQATAANRVRIYVNGVQQVLTASYGGYGTQNLQVIVNSGVQHNIGRYPTYTEYFDGYITEINFVNGYPTVGGTTYNATSWAALNVATLFGSYNTITGVWQPIKYSGTYSTNGFYLPFSLQNTSSYAASFNGSTQYLYLNGQSAFTFGANNFTIESWVYSTSASQTSVIYDGRPSGGTQGAYPTIFLASGVITYFVNSANLITGISLPVNQWTHVAIVRSGVTTTMYVNGVSQGSATDSTNYLSGGANRPVIAIASAGTNLFSGFLSNFRIVNGSAVYTSNFVPSSLPLTAITNTALLTLQNAAIVDNSTNAFTISNVASVTTSLATPFVANIGADASGNNNNWNPNNLNVASVGVTYDSMTDVPTLTSATTANYPTLNPLGASTPTIPVTLSNANLTAAFNRATNDSWVPATMTIPSTGKFYWEWVQTAGTVTGNPWAFCGVIDVTCNRSVAVPSVSRMIIGTNGNKYSNNGGNVAYGSAGALNDIFGVAVDMVNGKIFFSKNGTWQASSDPVAGTNAAFTDLVSSGATWVPAFYFGGDSTGTVNINFGQRPFSYTPPTGFVALNTYNLPTPTIANGAAQMAATLWTGTGVARNIDNSVNARSFQPDLVWVKASSAAYDNQLTDSVRGANKELQSNGTAVESNFGTVTAFNSNGFAVGTGASSNQNGINYVGWQWKESASSGFDIVTQTLSTTGINTITHNLNAVPKMVIAKATNVVEQWLVYQSSVTTQSQYLGLNTTAAVATSANLWGSSAFTSSQIYFSGTSGRNYVYYIFSEIAGFSKFGSYTGNGSADGVFVYLGFRPRFVMIKGSSFVSNWFIEDGSRNGYNVNNGVALRPNLTSPEDGTTTYNIDILSNGFKLRSSAADANTNGATFMYAAFAESPFNYSLAR